MKLTVVYHETLGMIGVEMPAHEVFVTVDYNQNLGDNLHRLMNKLLEVYPQLTN